MIQYSLHTPRSRGQLARRNLDNHQASEERHVLGAKLKPNLGQVATARSRFQRLAREYTTVTGIVLLWRVLVVSGCRSISHVREVIFPV